MGSRRPKWVGWIPAGILLLGIIGVGVGAAVVMNQGLDGPAPPPTTGQVTDLNWSIFTDPGLAYIDRTRDVRFNLTEPPIDAESLGLDDDGTIRIGPDDTDLFYSLIVFGGGEAPGGAEWKVNQLDVTTVGGSVESIIAIPWDYGTNFSSLLGLMEADAEFYGWQPPDRASIVAGMGDATRAGEDFSFGSGQGERLGVPIEVDATCHPSGYCDVEFTVTPATVAG